MGLVSPCSRRLLCGQAPEFCQRRGDFAAFALLVPFDCVAAPQLAEGVLRAEGERLRFGLAPRNEPPKGSAARDRLAGAGGAFAASQAWTPTEAPWTTDGAQPTMSAFEWNNGMQT